MKKGRAYNSGSFLLKVSEERFDNSDEILLNGSFVSSKKVFTTAVDRNTSKRRLKEAFVEAVLELKQENLILKLPSFVFLSKNATIKKSFCDMVEEIRQILLKNYIIR